MVDAGMLTDMPEGHFPKVQGLDKKLNKEEIDNLFKNTIYA